MQEDTLQNFYRQKVEGGGHSNLRNAVLDYLVKSKLDAEHYLDIGCADGSFTIQIAKTVGATRVFGVDLSPLALKEAQKRGILTYEIDINRDRLPFDSNSMDLVTSFEVIEHLVNTDKLISESYRVLMAEGCLIVSTPNLASWINRIYLVFGRQPRGFEVSLNVKLDGIIEGNYEPAGHIRLYTLRSLKDHMKSHGFKIVKTVGCPQPIAIHKYDPRSTLNVRIAGYMYNCIDKVVGRFSSLSNRFAIIARK